MNPVAAILEKAVKPWQSDSAKFPRPVCWTRSHRTIPGQVEQAIEELFDYFEAMAEGRRSQPRDDLISVLLTKG